MRYRLIGIRIPLVAVALLSTSTHARGQQVPGSHLDLDWQAPNRWVHVDNVDSQKAPLFENARKGWLAVLHRGDQLLGDGRPLFWIARSSPAGRTFFSFYPFRKWADLDTRREMITQTESIVGDEAVRKYDSGDAALVSPHYSQIWRRAESYDILWTDTRPLTELTATVGRLEVHVADFQQWDIFEQAWKQVAATLAARKYPLACRAFMSSYGKGEFMLWWLAPDSASYRSAPSLRDALAPELGPQKSAEVLAALDRVFPLKESYEVERRPDLSNLGR